MEFVINVAPRTKKNSMQIVTIKGRPCVIPSKQYKEYEKACKPYIPQLDEPITQRVNIKAVYYMPTRRKVDLTNLESALMDILVKHGFLEDDNSTIVYSTDGSHVDYDKENPRTEVEVMFL